jgi:hypothetical protein
MFEPRKMAKQILDFHKASFDTYFNNLIMIQEQMDRMSSMFMDQTTALPEEAKKAMTYWTKTYKKSCDEFKKTVDDNYKRVEAFFAEEKPEKAKSVAA